MRSTTKYWVRTADVSTVKHHILQHLPVFQYNVGDEDQQDSQLINSVYMDNSSMELYHGRLDKRPNAIALRIRYEFLCKCLLSTMIGFQKLLAGRCSNIIPGMPPSRSLISKIAL